MPLDRPATVRIYAEGTRNQHGEFVRGPSTDYRVWLTRIESTGQRAAESEGARQIRTASYRLRWFRELADADVARSHELLVDGLTMIITSVSETDNRDHRAEVARAVRDRRRWLAVEATESTS